MKNTRKPTKCETQRWINRKPELHGNALTHKRTKTSKKQRDTDRIINSQAPPQKLKDLGPKYKSNQQEQTERNRNKYVQSTQKINAKQRDIKNGHKLTNKPRTTIKTVDRSYPLAQNNTPFYAASNV